MAVSVYVLVTLLGALGAWIYGPVKHFTVVLGIRPFETWANVHGIEIRAIPNTVACEDLEYHPQSGMLYTACSGDIEIASGWMPGAGALEHPERPSYGTIVVIDPKTLKSQKLSLDNFKGPFSTHGIGLYTKPSDPKTVYIFAVNHLPNPKWTTGSTTEPKAASQIELFVHVVGSKTARHVRTITHPLIRTPNDVIAISENEFLVTNDHYYREGAMRLVEEFVRGLQSWTDLVHVRFDDEAVDAAVALTSVPTNNGLAWGPDQQVIISDATGGHVYFASLPGAENRTMTISHYIPIANLVDNANYFTDPYAAVDGKDYSGYLMPGLTRVLEFVEAFKDPTGQTLIPNQVWYLPAVAGKNSSVDASKLHRLVFADDGTNMRSATTAVMVPINPATNGGKREGWLFVASVISPHILASRVDFKSTLA
ncbi:hypothetical protein F5Y19DRAFT_402504 [Xylariaceae sp. FL1651]|nr:hypothetical protein F5Y19DRAFT_402504 [Xylariaceae sp. FL1651]